MKKLVLTILLGFVCLLAYSEEFTYGGITYKIKNRASREVATLGGTPIPHNDQPGNIVSGDITIPETVRYNGEEYTVIGLDYMSFIHCTGMTSISLPSTLRYIAGYALHNTGIQEIEIPNSVEKIGVGALFACRYLEKVTFGTGVTSIQDGVCKECPSLKEVDLGSLPSLPFEMFCRCTSLSEITIPATVESIGKYAFTGCTELKEITVLGKRLPDLKSEAFSSYKAELNLPEASDWSVNNTLWSNFKTINFAQNYNSASNTDNAGEQNIEIRYGGINYKILDKYKKTLCVTSTNVEGSITIPEKIDITNNRYTVIAIENGAFYNCRNLSSVSLPNSIIEIGEQAFSNCDKLSTVILSKSLWTIGDDAFNGCSRLKALEFPSSVSTIGKSAFKDCESLKEITLPNNVSVLGEGAFQGCKNLKKIILSNSLSTIENNTFYDCKSLSNVVFPASLTTIKASAFAYCSGLSEIKIPRGVFTIGASAFLGCKKLRKVQIENLVAWCNINFESNFSNPLRNQAQLFLNGEEISFLTIPSYVTEIKKYAFSGCTSILSLTVSDSVTTIENGAFSYCPSLVSVEIPSSVTTIDDGAFSFCNILKSVTLPSKFIPENIFRGIFNGCNGIVDILPSN